jgi:hypothetical protein
MRHVIFLSHTVSTPKHLFRKKALDKVITKCRKEDITRIPLSEFQQLLMLLFADDKVIISNAEGN